MNAPRTTEELMVRNVITCRTDDSLGHVRKLMQEHRIRHVPVVEAGSGNYAGVVTQKAVLREAIDIANKFGLADMENQEGKRKVESFMEPDAETVQPALPLVEAGRFFTECKHGCLPVVEEGRVVGILTSADFVKLSVRLLEMMQS